MSDPKDTLIGYLRSARDAIVWKVEGLSEYDARRPMTPTGTNLLGLVKHLASVEREAIDGRAGRTPADVNLDPDYDWPACVAKVEQAAREGSRDA